MMTSKFIILLFHGLNIDWFYFLLHVDYDQLVLVGNVQAEKLSGDTSSILKGNKSASNMASLLSLEQNR
jgi:hypothetical protein